ncbi:MAG: HAD family hydrolase [Micromonosporaceae bacterium]
MVRLNGVPRPRLVGLPKLVATDLDGTLVRSDYTVSGYTAGVLRRVRDAGITLVGITGRGPRLIDLCIEHVVGAHFLVFSQGSYVMEMDHGGPPRVVRRTVMDGAVITEAVRLIEADAGPVQLVVEALDHPGAPLWADAGVRWPYPEACEVRTRGDALAVPLLKAFVRSPELNSDELLAVARRVVPPALCGVTHSGLEFVELSPPGVNKASGLAVVADSLGIAPEQTLVFGDMPNDVPMFAWAGCGVAVANAHHELKAVADEVTQGNDEDGVARYLDRLLVRAA